MISIDTKMCKKNQITLVVRKERVENEEGKWHLPPYATHGYMPLGAVHWAGQVSGT